jgi:hypothetical protein
MWTCASCGWVNQPSPSPFVRGMSNSRCTNCKTQRGKVRNVATVMLSTQARRGVSDLVDMMVPVTASRGGVQTWADGRPWG